MTDMKTLNNVFGFPFLLLGWFGGWARSWMVAGAIGTPRLATVRANNKAAALRLEAAEFASAKARKDR